MSNSKEKIVCIVGPLPPPVHGLSVVNQFMIHRIKNAEIDTMVFDSKSISLKRNPINILFRFIRMLKIIYKYFYLLVNKRIRILYISLSGGFGQIYDLIIISLSHLFNIKIFIHHHSFAYLNKKSILTKFIVNITEKNATHIVLCENMGNLLQSYNSNITTKIISNIAFLSNHDKNNQNELGKTLNIGFLSNISFEKGIYEYVEVFKNLVPKYKINGIVAGPFSDNESKLYLEKNLDYVKNIKYIGSVANERKEQFFRQIDVLLFPTNYVNEAEPLVIHEAMSHGIPVIARSRGCINQIVDSNSGIIIDSGKDYITIAVETIIQWINDPNKLQLLKQQTLDKFNISKSNSIDLLDSIINEFYG